MGRYTLSMLTYDNQTINLRFNQQGKFESKVSLRTIDSLTTHFKDKESLIARLKQNYIIEDINITYLANRMMKSTYVAYEDKKDLVKLDMIDNSNIDINNSVFNGYMYDFLHMLEDREFFLFAINSDLLTYKQKEYLELRIINGNYDKFYEDKIKSYSSSYLQFRNLLFLMEHYKIKKQLPEVQIQSEEEIEYYDPDEDNLYSEDEKRQYQEYMDSLPDELPDYYEDDFEKVKRV